jgi:hypothetical protein
MHIKLIVPSNKKMQNKNWKPQMKALELINNSSNGSKKNICINSNPKHKAWKKENRKGEELTSEIGFQWHGTSMAYIYGTRVSSIWDSI